ncbi:LysR family transcriptional regulator [Paenibacillus sp. MY03]|uniref:LysR family transcriptional regulator n=1 Tax=Paenibacillus sp. MY03 TaxID=302980 RepID=UPI00211ACB57|nr:LysR family transcriptional regulator [Paenibacillus sp. MY03]
MELSQLEAFLAVCRVLNFTKASDHLHISQSAVTARIKALENSIGKVLFLRDNRNVTLTQAGIAFLPYAERMLHLFEESKLLWDPDIFRHCKRIILQLCSRCFCKDQSLDFYRSLLPNPFSMPKSSLGFSWIFRLQQSDYMHAT